VCDNDLPVWTWRGLGLAAVLILGLTLVLIALISSGALDPQPVGPLLHSESLAPMSVGQVERQIVWLNGMAPSGKFSLRLRGALSSGDADTGYGLVIGGERLFFVAVSPTGYVAVWEEGASAEPAHLLPWQTWPHIRGGNGVNELWLDSRDTGLTIRANGELLWQGQRQMTAGPVGIYVESFAGPATVVFEPIEYYGTAVP
jgi:hypothetical protein